MSRFKRSQAKYVKQTHTITNWPAYDQALVTRGSLTFWFTDDAIRKWTVPPSGRAGGQRKYSHLAIETALAFRMVFHLPWRQTKGCLQSLVEIHGVTLEIPHPTTFSRRAKGLGTVAFHTPRQDRPMHILVDSTGVRVHSGNLRTPPTNRAWRKLHLVVDAKTGDVAACDLGSSHARDAARVPALLTQVERPLAWVAADSAYDTEGVYAAIERHREGRSPRVLIPPTTHAQLRPTSSSSRERNRNIRSRTRLGTRPWHTRSGYSKRRLAETTMCRYKTILGPMVRARTLQGQRVEARVGCQILEPHGVPGNARESASGLSAGREAGDAGSQWSRASRHHDEARRG